MKLPIKVSTLWLPTIAIGLCLACGGSGSGIAANGLDEHECAQLLEKITEITYADLTADEIAQIGETADEFQDSVTSCVEEEVWTRPGFECVMKATSEADLKVCILKN